MIDWGEIWRQFDARLDYDYGTYEEWDDQQALIQELVDAWLEQSKEREG